MLHRRARAATSASVLALVIAALLLPASAGAVSSRKVLAGSVPSWAKSSSLVGHAVASDAVGFRVYLGWRDEAAAEALARSVADPKSASYGKYVTPAVFRQRFAPAEAQASAVRSWLRSQGFSVVYTPANKKYVAAEGTVAQAEAAFAVKLNNYRVRGTTVRAPATAVSVPSTLAAVTTVVGLDQSAYFVHTDNAKPDAPPSSAFVNAPPCSEYWAEKIATGLPTAYGSTSWPYAPCGHTPAQLRGAYGTADAIAAGLDGRGQTVAVIDAYASPTILADVNEYSSRHGLPAMNASNFTQVVPPGIYRKQENKRHDPQGWYGEETLDIEIVHAMAPGAKIVYVGSPNNFRDLDAAVNHVVDRNLAQIVTNSYGYATELLPPGFVKPINDMFIQAAAQGIGVYFSSGDSGDEIENIGFRTVDWPAASPWVTAVGGTSLGVTASNGYLFETGWGTKRSTLTSTGWNPAPPGTFLYASGGGTSRLFAQPSYQAGVVPDSLADFFGTGRKWRVVPDIAAVGDPNTGFLVGQTQTFPDGSVRYSEYRIGGTSLSSPLMAGIMAIADQKAGFHHGFANPALYSLAGSSALRDVTDPSSTVAVVRVDYVNGVDAANGTTTSLRTMNQTGTLHTRVGYDDVTGIGSPRGPSFLNALAP